MKHTAQLSLSGLTPRPEINTVIGGNAPNLVVPGPQVMVRNRSFAWAQNFRHSTFMHRDTSQKLRAALEKCREVLSPVAQADLAWQIAGLRKAQELKHTLRPRGPDMGR